jgi:hypothetical protein
VENSYSNTSLDAQSQSSNSHIGASPGGIVMSPSGTFVQPQHGSAGGSEADEASASSESSHVTSTSNR